MQYLLLLLTYAALFVLGALLSSRVLARDLTAGEYVAWGVLLGVALTTIHTVRTRQRRRRQEEEDMRDSALW
jgi:branched-subunit amino acid transport protein